MRTVRNLLWAVSAVPILPAICTATPTLYSQQDLQQELDKAHHSHSWQALAAWLANNGYVKDTGTEGGGTDMDSYGPTASVMETYHHSVSTRNACLVKVTGDDSQGHKQDYFYISESVYANGTTYYYDWFYDPQTDTVGNTPPGGTGNRPVKPIAINWAQCVLSWCGGSAGGCALANMVDGEIGWAPCWELGCGTSEIACTIDAALSALRQ